MVFAGAGGGFAFGEAVAVGEELVAFGGGGFEFLRFESCDGGVEFLFFLRGDFLKLRGVPLAIIWAYFSAMLRSFWSWRR